MSALGYTTYGDQQQLAAAVKTYIDKQVERLRSGRTSSVFNEMSDADLAFELMARGYGVFRLPGSVTE